MSSHSRVAELGERFHHISCSAFKISKRNQPIALDILLFDSGNTSPRCSHDSLLTRIQLHPVSRHTKSAAEATRQPKGWATASISMG